MILKGAIILFAFASLMALIMFCIIIALEDESECELTDEEIAEERSRYACYEDGEIDDV